MLSLHLFELAGFLLGLFLGSFLNVVIARVPLGHSIATPRSHCTACGHTIRWYDNIPILSWLLLRGKCRDCGATISWQYPAVEFATGLWLLVIAGRLWYVWHWQLRVSDIGPDSLPLNTLLWLTTAILGLFLIPLIVIDWRIQRLPDALTFSGIASAAFLVCTQAIFLEPAQGQIIFAFKHLRLASPGSFAARGNVFLTGTEALIFGRLAAVCGIVLLLLAIRWTYKAIRHRDGIGLGDVKLLAMIAAFLGFELTILTLFVGTFLASLYGIYLLARHKANALTKLPFGSFLGVAALVVALHGDEVIRWYKTLFQ